MRAIVTGATGYLGSRITKDMLNRGWELLCPTLSDCPTAYLDPYLNQVRLLKTGSPNFSDVIRAFAPDAVIHTACCYGRGETPLDDVIDANLTFPLQVLNAVIREECPPLWLNANTSLPKNLNSYALSKHQFAHWGCFFAGQRSVDFCDIMMEQFYGEHDSGSKFIPFLLEKFRHCEPIPLTDGEQRRDIVYIDDVVAAYMFLLEKHPVGFTRIPLGTGEAPKIKEVTLYLKELLRSSSSLQFGALERRDGEPEILAADISILQAMGFSCTVHWKDGLRRIVTLEESL